MPLRRNRVLPLLVAAAVAWLLGGPLPAAEAQWWKRGEEPAQINYGIRFLDLRTHKPVTAPIMQARAGERQLLRVSLYELHNGEPDPTKPLPRGPRGPVTVRCTTSDATVAHFDPERSLIVRSGGDAFAEFWFVPEAPGSVRIEAVADLGDGNTATTWFGPIPVTPPVVATPRRLQPKPEAPTTPTSEVDTDEDEAVPATENEAKPKPDTKPAPQAATTNPMALPAPVPRSTTGTHSATAPKDTTDSAPDSAVTPPPEPEPAPAPKPEPPPVVEPSTGEPPVVEPPVVEPPTESAPEEPAAMPAPVPEPEISDAARKAGYVQSETGEIAVPTPPSDTERQGVSAVDTPNPAEEELQEPGAAKTAPPPTPAPTETAEAPTAPAPAPPSEAPAPAPANEPPPPEEPWPEDAVLPCPRFERLTLENVSDVHLRVQIRVAGTPAPLAATMKPGEQRRLRPGSGDTVWIEAQRPNGEHRGIRLVAANVRPDQTSQIPQFSTPWLRISSELAECESE